MGTLVILYDGSGNIIANSNRNEVSPEGGLRAIKRRAAEEYCAEYLIYRGRRRFDFPRYFTRSGPMGFWYELRRDRFLNMIDEAITNTAHLGRKSA